MCLNLKNRNVSSHSKSHNYAFTLVELSIVLVILGLLAGGVMYGQNLIRAAELRSVASDLEKFRGAAQTFRGKYLQLPGDFNKAESFWGSMSNCTAAGPSGTGTQTCNGDGDGVLENPTAASRVGEIYTFWQQLANAGLIEGIYNGIAGSSNYWHVVTGVNSPPSKFGNAGWGLLRSSNITDKYATTLNRTLLVFGREESTTFNGRPVLMPEEAWNIDQKIDDAIPGRGFVLAYNRGGFAANPNYCTSATSNTDYDIPYNLQSTNISCALFFMVIE